MGGCARHLLVVALVLLWPLGAGAQNAKTSILRDGSIGPGIEVQPEVRPRGVGSEVLVPESLGLRRGGVLFHSFSAFDVGRSDFVVFSGDPATSSVLARVTGTKASEIDGWIQSTIEGADVYLLNTSGFIFGPNSHIDVPGTFHAATADSILFPQGATFEAALDGAVPALEVSKPDAFGFLGGSDAKIVVNGNTFLQNARGLDFRAGSVELRAGATLATLAQSGKGGDIVVVAEDRVVLSGVNAGRGAARLSTSALGANPAGSIRVTAPLVILSDGAAFVSAASANAGSGDIEVAAGSSLILSGRATGSSSTAPGASIFTTAPVTSAGTGGDIVLRTPALVLDDGALILATASGVGDGGDVRILSTSDLHVSGSPRPSADSALILAESTGAGRGGGVEIGAAGDVEIDQVSFGTEVAGEGAGGPVHVSAGGTVRLVGSRDENVLVASLASTDGSGDAGDFRIDAREIVLDGGAAIFTNPDRAREGAADTPPGEPPHGEGGEIVLVASDAIRLRGRNAQGLGSVIASSSRTAGAAGGIRLSAPTIELADGANVLSDALAEGAGGSIVVTADREISLTGATVAAQSLESGDAGAIELGAPVIVVRDGSSIASGAAETGAGGPVTIRAGESFWLHGSEIDARTIGQGKAGDVLVEAPVIVVDGGSFVSTSAILETGAGGDIVLRAGKSITLSGRGGDLFSAVLSSFADSQQSEGEPGSIRLEAPVVRLENGAAIDVSTYGGRQGGSVEIVADQSLTLTGRSKDGTDVPSSISAQAGFGSGAAGSIHLTAGNVVLEDGAGIRSSTSDAGAGGSILLDVNDLSLRGGAALEATAARSGDAGSIEIGVAGGRYATSRVDLEGSEITTSAGGSNAGSIRIDAETVHLASARIAASAEAGFGGTIAINGEGVEVRGDGELAPRPPDAMAGKLVHLEQSEISTRVGSGAGDGGNVLVNSDSVVLQESRISASAESGNGGNILVQAQAAMATGGSFSEFLDVSAASGVSGAAQLTAPEVDLESQVTPLDPAFVDALAELRPACAARAQQGGTGSFSVARQRGLPASPEGLLLAFDELGVEGDADLPAVAAAPGGASVAPGTASPAPLQLAQASLAQGAVAFRGGHYDAAAQSLAEASKAYTAAGDTQSGADALRGLGQSQQAQGLYAESLASLSTALERARAAKDPVREAAALGSLGDTYLALGDAKRAEEHLSRGVALAQQAQDAALAARLLNNLGNLQASQRRYDEALASYAQSAERAAEASDAGAEARARTSAGRAALEAGDLARAASLLAEAHAKTSALPASRDKAALEIHYAKSQERLAELSPAQREASLLAAFEALRSAGALAKEARDPQLLSYALGNLGALYEEEHREEEALYLTRQAIRAAEQANTPEPLYRWHWQEGRLLWAEGNANGALASYRRAVEILEETRPETRAQYGSAELRFRRAVAPVYLDLVTALLGGSDLVQDRAARTRLLVEARATTEELKAAELRDYFRDECVAEIEAKQRSLDAVAEQAAVVYPILLPERLELLVTLPSGLERYTVPVASRQVEETVEAFRQGLLRRVAFDYHAPAEQLYDWLVRPYASRLEEEHVTTLVFVPDGALRTIPLAALQDGQEFLVSRYALAVTPGLSLVDPKPLDAAGAKVLLAGVSEGVQGFEALPNVPREIEAIHALYGGDVLLDASFETRRFETELATEEPSVVHVASHAVFTGDPKTSFLLTHDDRLTMEGLSEVVAPTQFRRQPLELLALSACETAAGDERAALGLAGVAIRAGARSALGSLWRVHDEATYELVVTFYQALKEPGVSKAEALRRAQQKLLESPAFSHPFYWSPFLLISNWL